MKTLAITLALALIGSTTFANDGNGDKYTVQTKTSTLNWVGKKVGGSHTGTIAIKEGTLTVANGKIETALVTIDMTTIRVTDEGMDDGTKGKLVGHLSSPDFFNVEEHTTAIFQLTSFTAIQNSTVANYTVTGKLTIKGITHEITFPAIVRMSEGRIEASANLTFDRSKWDVRYGSGSFFDNLGDKVIYDDVQIGFNFVATK